MDIISLVSNIPNWKDFFEQEDVIDELLFLEPQIESIKNPIPLLDNIFRPFYQVSPNKVDVCIIFDRPPNMYDEFNKGVPVSNGIGCGLEDSISEMTYKIGNIYAELSRCFKNFDTPQRHTFTGWNRVLILNCMMLIEAGSENNSNVWLPFINNVISYLESRSVIFILCCGSEYEKRINSMIKKSRIITCPNPLSKQFIGCGAFTECNAELKKLHKKRIDWTKINE